MRSLGWRLGMGRSFRTECVSECMRSGNDARRWPIGKLMSRSEEIEDLAEVLAKEFWKDGRVNPSDIATNNGLTFNFGHYEDYFDGLLECKSQRFHVYLNLDTNKSAESP